MSPRLQLTAVPYAFDAGQLKTSNGTNSATLNIVQPGGSYNETFQIPDQGASGTYNLLTTTAANTNYIQNSTGGPQTANFNIQAASSGTAGTIGAVIQPVKHAARLGVIVRRPFAGQIRQKIDMRRRLGAQAKRRQQVGL